MILRLVPSWPTYWATVRSQLGLQILIIVLAMTSLLISTRNPISALLIGIFAFGLGALVTWMYFRNASVEVFNTGAVVKRSWIGTSRTFSVAEIDSSLYALEVADAAAPALPTLLLMRSDGTALLRLRGYYWERAALEALIGALRITPIFVPQRVTPKDLKAVHPRAISWPEANRVAFALILAGSIVVVVLLAAFIAVALVVGQR